MSLASRSTRGALFLGLGSFANILVGFFGGIVLARLLGPNDFGTFALAVTLGAFVDVRTKLQIDQKFLRDQDHHPDYLDVFFTVNLMFAVLSMLLISVALVGALMLNRADLAICLGVLGILGPIETLTATIRLSIEKKVAFKAVAFIQTLASLTQFAVTLVSAAMGLGLASLLLGTIAGALLNVALFLRVAPHRPKLKWDKPLAREFITYGVRYGFVFALSGVTLTQFDNFIIGLFGGTFVLGFYDRAYRTALWPTLLISSALGRISLPTYAQLQDDATRLSKAFSMVLWTVLTCASPIALTLLVTAPDLVPTLYGEKWSPSVPILQVLAAFAMFRPLWDDLISVLVATKRSGQMARLVFIQAIVLIMLATPLTWLYGGTGTAISVGIAFLISAGYLFYFGKVYLKIDLRSTVGMPLFNNLVALGLYFLVRMNLSLDPFSAIWRLSIEATLLLGLYVLVSLLFSGRLIFDRVAYMVQLARGK